MIISDEAPAALRKSLDDYYRDNDRGFDWAKIAFIKPASTAMDLTCANCGRLYNEHQHSNGRRCPPLPATHFEMRR